MKFAVYQQIFEKGLNVKFHQNPYSGSCVVPRERKDGHKANSRFSQFCERNSKLIRTAVRSTVPSPSFLSPTKIGSPNLRNELL
jgi:hypothetical protein